MKLFTLILVILSLTACKSEVKAKFEIINQTQGTIDSINIKSFDHHSTPNYLKLEPGESQIYWLDMNDLPKVDGDYLLSYKSKKQKIIRKRFGYFTNGFPSKNITKITIEQDTIVIDLQ